MQHLKTEIALWEKKRLMAMDTKSAKERNLALGKRYDVAAGSGLRTAFTETYQ